MKCASGEVRRGPERCDYVVLRRSRINRNRFFSLLLLFLLSSFLERIELESFSFYFASTSALMFHVLSACLVGT